ncbi:MAG: DUF3488 domain-containing protein [Thermoguttaceae bacterium]|nr:DUF3488 domain-containing protein [Thermoguttaceae bacterium]
MTIERFLQLSLSGQIILAAYLLFSGQDVYWGAPVVAALVLISFFVVDKYQLFHLSSFWINTATILITCWCLYDIVFYVSPFQLTVRVANGLTLIEMVLLLRRKTFHNYWLLFLLSFFLVVVGSAFRQNTIFGFLLLLFMTNALVSLTALTFYRQANEGDEAGKESAVKTGRASSERIPICSRLIWKHVFIGLFSLLICALFFVFTPRFGEGAFLGIPGRNGAFRPTVGFNDVVRLGELGPSQKDQSIVCQVKLFQGDSDAPAIKPMQLYLRGVALNVYENRQWRFQNHSRHELFPQPTSALKKFGALRTKASTEDNISDLDLTTRIQYNQQPTGRIEAFTVWPFYPRDRVQYRIVFSFNGLDQRLKRNEFYTRQPHTYEFYSPSVQHGIQVEITPKLYPQEFAPLLQIPYDDDGNALIPNAQKLAEKWLDEAGMSVEKDGVEAVARHLCRKLRDSGEHVYSLNPQPRNRNLDPLEDFLSEHKAGHCEFFASALTMILRSVGIPAQLVVGYATNEYYKYGHYFIVRQSCAHAWVDVWIPPSQLDLDYDSPVPSIVTAENFNSYKKTWPQRDWRYGGWLRLDPTPSVSEEDAQVNAFLDWFGSMFDWMNVQWEKYMITMDSKTQQTQVYAPIWNAGQQFSFVRWIKKVFHNLSVRTVLTVLILIFIGLYWTIKLLKVLWKWLQFRFKLKGSSLIAVEVRIEFYRRFEKALQRRGFTRRADQTPLEFALELEGLPQFANWTIRPKEIAMKYYAVRYGGETASAEWIRSVQSVCRNLKK